jgi:ketosteroid isomerase-like protein
MPDSKATRRTVLALAGAPFVAPVAAAAESRRGGEEAGMRDWFDRYIDAFNRSDFEGFGKYYAEDVQFDGQGGSFAGRAAVLDFYRTVKARLQETLTVLGFTASADRITVELETTLEAREDWPDFPTGPLAKGERRESVNFIVYDVADGRFVRIRSARFRPLPANDMRDAERRLHAYMAAFNGGDYDALRTFYADDVVLVIGNGTELRGVQAIIDFYRDVKANTRRTIKILRTFPARDGIAAELESEFLAVEDVPDFTSGPMRKGDRLYINSFVVYDTRDGRYTRIRAAVFKRIWRRA